MSHQRSSYECRLTAENNKAIQHLTVLHINCQASDTKRISANVTNATEKRK